MILIFGGTTEGKKVASLFDIIDQAYYYSTKTDVHKSVKGNRIHGALNSDTMKAFCEAKGIRLIIDAAHPFAEVLHQTIIGVAQDLDINTIRYERQFPQLEPNESLRLFDDYEELSQALLTSKYTNILALTGVQTISKLQDVWHERKCYFRILNSELSSKIAMETGIAPQYLIPRQPVPEKNELIELVKQTSAQVILSKESGESGYFPLKMGVAKELNLPLWVVKKPYFPEFKNCVNNPKSFLQLFYRFKKELFKDNSNLRSGFTTGTCVTAAAKACLLALMEGQFPEWVEVDTPSGKTATYPVFPINKEEGEASCIVIKDSGDDPDVTHAKEIGCSIELNPYSGIVFKQGKGIGRVTLPGLQVEVGEPAINPVPRRMITDMLQEQADEYDVEPNFIVTPFVPEGKELAKQTFNPRVGVVDGISILGTSGRVMPYSNEAFVASIKQQVAVVKELKCNEVVMSSGKRSKNKVAKHFTNLPSQAFVHYGNLIGETIKLTVEADIKFINLAVMFGKGVKLAEGHLDTHSKNVVFNPDFLVHIAKHCDVPLESIELIKRLKLANAILDILPLETNTSFYERIAQKCYSTCLQLIPEGHFLKVFLLMGDSEIVI
ncbi:cobalt-precorrin-5B (C(1))-methyltransferase CbiD [Carboxylicivirga sp. N1Y90]|uniref:cobalt-precorrin-5B (C(1))-methyltransferase CbiD n=1 Tax=Carboxylicivirga fragile TaxID=3417571 RepID=UPI003D33A78B|nr:cobalamin biosynthesis protein CbiD [Marinilabiliaceae bacterium N1Y90]